MADAVCQINNWGRCSLPIHTLEIGLKHRQVDTVASFLKSKEHCKYFLLSIMLKDKGLLVKSKLLRSHQILSLYQPHILLKVLSFVEGM